jgi:hypothetical protein
LRVSSGVSATTNRRALESVDQVVERALVDQLRRVAFDHRLRDPERICVEAFVEHAYVRAQAMSLTLRPLRKSVGIAA